MATWRSDNNAGRGGRDTEVTIDLADGEAGSAGDHRWTPTLVGHLGKLGKLHDVFNILSVGSGKLCGLLLR